VTDVSLEKIIPDQKKSLRKGAMIALGTYKNNYIFNVLEAVLETFNLDLNTPVEEFNERVMAAVLHGITGNVTVKSKIGLRDKNVSFDGIIPFILEQAEEGSNQMKRWAAKFTHMVNCPSCDGKRLKKSALFFKIGDKNIQEVSALSIDELHQFMGNLPDALDDQKKRIGGEVIKEIRDRTKFLLDVGLDYLSLDRSSRSLSGGEAQRIRLATQIGSDLVGVLYILDEPSIGLHQRDDERLISSLKELRDAGNSVIVVEHDKEMIMNADYVLDIGPGAGEHGGRVMASGTPAEIIASKTLTGEYLRNAKKIAVPQKRREGNGKSLIISGARGNNLKSVTVEFPLGKFICITGVSGSGKSTLVADTLYPILNQHFYRGKRDPLKYESVQGLEHLDKVIEVDQSPIGRTPRSNPATYTGAFDHIRSLFAALPSAKIRGYKPGRFSFNTAGGRCETCKGAGVRIIEMNFLPEVAVPCSTCRGKRFDRETLEVRFKGKSISDVLEMSVEDAYTLFSEIPKIKAILKTLLDVGLGYLTLGQSSTTVSGGEAQRIKLASELSKRSSGNTFYILDEPTTGLHFEDVNQLIGVLNKLTDQGNTVLIIEHQMDVIKAADHVIDLGPEGGQAGGMIVATGTPESVAKVKDGYTATYLRKELFGS
jgi:excinuclease ABC subunit A